MAPVPPIGTIMAYAGPITTGWEIANGWLLCNGRQLDRTRGDSAGGAYQPLFDAIGSSWGGDGVNMFNIPDALGRFLRGVDSGKRRDEEAEQRTACNAGGHTGDQVGTVQSDQVGPHGHPVNDPGHAHGITGFNEDGHGGMRSAFPRDGRGYGTEQSTTHIGVMQNDGKESRPRNVSVHWIIRYK